MRRDLGLIRAILLAVEASEGERVLAGDVPGYTESDVIYHMRLAIEAGLVHGQCKPDFCQLARLTWAGHELLDAVRAKTVWHATLKRAREAGVELTLDSLKAVAVKVTLELLGAA